MKTVRHILFIACCLGTVLWVEATPFHASGRGTSAAEFLKLGAGARAMALGEAFTAIADDPTALYWNPACLMRVKTPEASFMYGAYLESSNYDYGAYAQPLGPNNAMGLGIQFFTAGNLTQRDTNGTDTGSFNPQSLSLSAGYAHQVAGFSFGTGLKFIRTEIIDKAQTGALDIGVLSPIYLNRIRLAFVASNLGGKIKFDQDQESLPVAYTLGSSYKFSDHLISGLDVKFPRDNQPYASIGTEWILPAGRTWGWAIRVGYNSRTLNNIDGMTGLSLGGGFVGDLISIDYGFVPLGNVGLTHLISVSAKFGASRAE